MPSLCPPSFCASHPSLHSAQTSCLHLTLLHPPIHPSSLPPSFHPSMHSSTCATIHPSLPPFMHAYICPSIHPSFLPFMHTCVHPSLHPSIHPSMYPSVHPPPPSTHSPPPAPIHSSLPHGFGVWPKESTPWGQLGDGRAVGTAGLRNGRGRLGWKDRSRDGQGRPDLRDG